MHMNMNPLLYVRLLARVHYLMPYLSVPMNTLPDASLLHCTCTRSPNRGRHVCGREHFCKRILPVFYLHLQKNVSWRDESWTAFCGLITATIGGLWAERFVKSTRRPSKWHYTYGGSGGWQSITMLYCWPQTHCWELCAGQTFYEDLRRPQRQ